MKKHVIFLATAALAANLNSSAQFSAEDVKYWIGSGTDTTIMFIDFHQDIGAGTPSCYGWGYLHEPGATGMDMLTAIDAADDNLSLEFVNGFLNSMYYGPYAGIGGAEGVFYWSTWSGENVGAQEMNMGLDTEVIPGGVFACSYTDWNPPLPALDPGAAYDPQFFTASDVEYWTGEGDNQCTVVIDFGDADGEIHSYAWGYRFSGLPTAGQVLTQIASADEQLEVVFADGVGSISYAGLTAITGEAGNWSVWAGTNIGNWQLASGVNDVVADNDFVGFSFSPADTAIRPEYPVAAPISTDISSLNVSGGVQFFPNPASDFVYVKRQAHKPTELVIFDVHGRKVATKEVSGTTGKIDLTDLVPNIYWFGMDHTVIKIAVH